MPNSTVHSGPLTKDRAMYRTFGASIPDGPDKAASGGTTVGLSGQVGSAVL